MGDKLDNNGTTLFENVVKGGYCIGCGVCALVKDSPIKINFDEFSKLQATTEEPISNTLNEKLLTVCPFSGSSKNENIIGEELYGESANHHPKIGYYLKNFAGYVSEDGFRMRGSSGGMGSWILKMLLNENLIDGVIHVKDRIPTQEDKRLFSYQISKNVEEINKGAKSKYYPIELSEAIHEIKKQPGKYAIVGIPCFIKAIRLLTEQDDDLKDKIEFCIGLICGHLKSTRYAEMFAWQCDVNPSNLYSIDFRNKLENFGANHYGVTVTENNKGKKTVKKSPPINQLYGSDWGHGFFKYKACDYCDDVMAETADVTIGDAWLPQFINDSMGTNVIVVRHPKILELIEHARQKKKLNIDEIDVEQIVKSQSSGLYHRREGLSYRLLLADNKREWRPIKRVKAENILSLKTSKIQKLRMKIAEHSHISFNKAIQKNEFSVFKTEMSSLLAQYSKLYKPPIWIRVLNKIKKIFLFKTI